jgi:hypothetical protein
MWKTLLMLFILLAGCAQEPEYIRESFKNGVTIEMPVDNSITRDNWECTGDCSGHDAGYSWAEEKGITDPSGCSGKSISFIEGCEAYANDN